ncbi:signal peptidase I [Paenibacillus marinisediminis]
MNWKAIRQYALIIMLGVGISFLIQEVAYAQIVVNQKSMQHTYDPGDRLLENKWIYHLESPQKGEVVILHEPETGRRLIKRVIATAGDTIDMRDGHLIVNGVVQDEPYVWGETYPNGMTLPYTVPDQELFVIGDNREISKDSRAFGSVPLSSVEGKVVAKLWPLF